MQQNPMHSQDLQHGVPWEFNQILDDLLEGNQPVMNEEEYKMQMNLSLSQIPPETPIGGPENDGQQIEQRMLTEIEEKSASGRGSQAEQASEHSQKSRSQPGAEGMSTSPSEPQVRYLGQGGASTVRNMHSKKVSFGGSKLHSENTNDEGQTDMMFQIDDAEQ